MNALRLFIVACFISSFAISADTIYGSYSSTYFKDYNKAVRYATKPSRKKIKNALGCSSYIITEKGGDSCKQNKKGKYKCKGYVIAHCKWKDNNLRNY